jgi:hypothetical protein
MPFVTYINIFHGDFGMCQSGINLRLYDTISYMGITTPLSDFPDHHYNRCYKPRPPDRSQGTQALALYDKAWNLSTVLHQGGAQ